MNYKKILSWTLAASMSLCSTAPAMPAYAAGQEGDTSRLIERTASENEDGMIHFSYQDETGTAVSIDTSGTKTALKKATVLPSSYDSREHGTTTPVRDQGVTGACWAFGAIKALESSGLSSGLLSEKTSDLSENHLIWYTYNHLTDTSDPLYGDYIRTNNSSANDYYNLGGNAYMAMYTLANGWGAVTEAAAPFSADTSQALKNMAASMQAQDDSLRTQSDISLKEACLYDNADISEIKQLVMEQGAVNVSLYYDQSKLYRSGKTVSAYDSTHSSEDANHSVTIIGWDDSFRTFSSAVPGSGAWLIANSYGEDYTPSMSGCYWVSYYDTSLCEFCSFVAESSETYNTRFQYDGFGWGNFFYDNNDLRFANIFQNTSGENITLEAAGFYSYTDNQPYEIEVYRGISGNSPVKGTLVSGCSTSGEAAYNGYHTVPLQDSVTIRPGEAFSVVITFLSVNGSTVYVPVEGTNNSSFAKYSSSAGQSYIYSPNDGGWFDTTKYRQGRRTTCLNNVCIKVFGNTSDASVLPSGSPASEGPDSSAVPSGSPATEDPDSSAVPSGSPVTDIPGRSALPLDPSASELPEASVSPSGSAVPDLVDTSALPSGSAVPGTAENPVRTSEAPGNAPASPAGSSSGMTIISPSTQPPNTSAVPAAFPAPSASASPSASPRSTAGTVSGSTSTSKNSKTDIVIMISQKKKLTIKKGRTVQIKLTVSPASEKKNIHFISSNKKVAAVSSSGKIRGKKKGTAIIRIRHGKRLLTKITVTVKPKKKK